MPRHTQLFSPRAANSARTHAGIAPRAAVVGVVVALAACNVDRTVTVQAPDQVSPSALTDSTTLSSFLAGAQGDFQIAYAGAGGSEGQVNVAGLFTDEFIQTESFPTRFEIDTRNIVRENTTMGPIFLNLQRARASAERAAARYVQFQQASAVGRSDALNLAGFGYILFGENYCSGVPFSTIAPDFISIQYGTPQTTAQMFQTAVAQFDTVLAAATSTATQKNLARIGRGRALLNLGRFTEARDAVAGVAPEFQFLIQASDNTGTENNGVWSFSTSAGRWGVADGEGGTGLPFVTQADARVASRPRSVNGGNGFDGGPMREQLKYPARTSPTVLADGVEAQLIVAEAALKGGDVTTFLATLNGLRTNTAVLTNRGIAKPLPTLTDPGTDAARQDLLFRERAYWLFLTSHRLGDLRRLVRQYGRSASAVFPSGAYSSNGRTGVYGSDVNFPIPIDESQNPSLPGANDTGTLRGCIDRNA